MSGKIDYKEIMSHYHINENDSKFDIIDKIDKYIEEIKQKIEEESDNNIKMDLKDAITIAEIEKNILLSEAPNILRKTIVVSEERPTFPIKNEGDIKYTSDETLIEMLLGSDSVGRDIIFLVNRNIPFAFITLGMNQESKVLANGLFENEKIIDAITEKYSKAGTVGMPYIEHLNEEIKRVTDAGIESLVDEGRNAKELLEKIKNKPVNEQKIIINNFNKSASKKGYTKIPTTKSKTMKVAVRLGIVLCCVILLHKWGVDSYFIESYKNYTDERSKKDSSSVESSVESSVDDSSREQKSTPKPELGSVSAKLRDLEVINDKQVTFKEYQIYRVGDGDDEAHATYFIDGKFKDLVFSISPDKEDEWNEGASVCFEIVDQDENVLYSTRLNCGETLAGTVKVSGVQSITVRAYDAQNANLGVTYVDMKNATLIPNRDNN